MLSVCSTLPFTSRLLKVCRTEVPAEKKEVVPVGYFNGVCFTLHERFVEKRRFQCECCSEAHEDTVLDGLCKIVVTGSKAILVYSQ